MNKVYNVDLSKSGISELKKGLKEYKKWINKKTEELCKRLAEIGVQNATINFSAENVVYDGIVDVQVSKASRGKNEWVVKANGATVLFIEFGAGVYYPDAELSEYENASGMVHGTYGKGLGNNPYWFYTGQPGTAGGELAHGHPNSTITHGNPANMSMYATVKDLEYNLEKIVKEVFT